MHTDIKQFNNLLFSTCYSTYRFLFHAGSIARGATPTMTWKLPIPSVSMEFFGDTLLIYIWFAASRILIKSSKNRLVSS
jgi:hypothetical protein